MASLKDKVKKVVAKVTPNKKEVKEKKGFDCDNCEDSGMTCSVCGAGIAVEDIQ